MKLLHGLIWASAGVAALGLAGCRHHGSVYVERSAPPRTVYVEEPAYVVVQEPPPAIIVERRLPPPSGLHIWIDGFWHWDGHRYGWHRGHYELPPRGHAVWVAPRYERHDREYHYTPGHWGEGRSGGPQGDRGGQQGRGPGAGSDRGRDRD